MEYFIILKREQNIYVEFLSGLSSLPLAEKAAACINIVFFFVIM